MDCERCENQLSDFLETALTPNDQVAVRSHLQSCENCALLLKGMKDVIGWGRILPRYTAPEWLPVRIVANTPQVVRETYPETFKALIRNILEPRTAMAVFTGAVVLGWMAGLAGLPENPVDAVRNPAAIYYRVYDQAIRAYYRSPLMIRVVTQMEAQLEEIRENL